jgi:hypothetical protein
VFGYRRFTAGFQTRPPSKRRKEVTNPLFDVLGFGFRADETKQKVE